MSLILRSITVFETKKKSKEISKADLKPGKGLPGDRHYSDDSNQISTLFHDNTNGINDVDEENNSIKNAGRGLCHAKFKANLSVSTRQIPYLNSEKEKNTIPMSQSRSDYEKLTVGDKFKIGDAVLKVTMTKHCFDECILRQNDEYCHLRNNACFTEVEKGGIIVIGDRLLNSCTK